MAMNAYLFQDALNIPQIIEQVGADNEIELSFQLKGARVSYFKVQTRVLAAGSLDQPRREIDTVTDAGSNFASSDPSPQPSSSTRIPGGIESL